MYGYTYLVVNTINDHWYVGMHKCDTYPNLDENYWASGIRINRAFKKYGLENFKRYIIKWCYTKQELVDHEERIIREWGAVEDPNCYNTCYGGYASPTLIPEIALAVKEANERAGNFDPNKEGSFTNKGQQACRTPESRRKAIETSKKRGHHDVNKEGSCINCMVARSRQSDVRQKATRTNELIGNFDKNKPGSFVHEGLKASQTPEARAKAAKTLEEGGWYDINNGGSIVWSMHTPEACEKNRNTKRRKREQRLEVRSRLIMFEGHIVDFSHDNATQIGILRRMNRNNQWQYHGKIRNAKGYSVYKLLQPLQLLNITEQF